MSEDEARRAMAERLGDLPFFDGHRAVIEPRTRRSSSWMTTGAHSASAPQEVKSGQPRSSKA